MIDGFLGDTVGTDVRLHRYVRLKTYGLFTHRTYITRSRDMTDAKIDVQLIAHYGRFWD